MKWPLLIFCCLVLSSVKAQQSYSLQDCIELAFKNNLELKGQELNIQQAENTLRQSKNAVYPSASGSFSHGLNFGRSIDPFTNSFVQRSISSNSFGLSSNWTLFNGFSTRNQIEQNKTNLQSEYYASQKNKRELKIKITLAYMQVLMNQELYSIALEQENALARQLEVIKETVKEGLKAKTNIIDFEAQLAASAFDALTARNNITLSKLALVQILGLSNSLNFEVENMTFNNTGFNENLRNDILTGLDHQPALKAAELKVKSAVAGIKIATAARYPTVSINGGLGSAYSSAAASEFNYFNQLNYNFNQYLRLGINFPVYTNGQTRGRIKAAEITHKVLENQYGQQLQQLSTEVEQAFLSTRMAYEKLSGAGLNLKAQQLAFESASERFNEGLLNSTELNTFRTNLEKAKSNLIQVQYEFQFRKRVLEVYKE
ncbi:TolC family protein [Emticicia sp. CRIBPO]|uniref:TolC family protein n=1 Tax=Emticicia sp. CRIBPO TaxID=2683258 RepID=UPI0014122FAD|nr:TolC family protein [Emticicia sp. CRIBPO]NBA88711.1 TolC family protein [Emticicia sp. CRIBPO]